MLRSRRVRRLVLAGTTLATAAGLMTGCSNDPDPVSEGDWSVRGALRDVPGSAVEDGVWVQTGDIEAALEAAGVERDEDSELSEWVLPITGFTSSPDEPGEVFVPLPETIHPGSVREDHFADVVGVDLVEVESFVSQAQPPVDFTVLVGEGIDEGSLSDDLIEQGGVLTDIEGEDLATDFAKSESALSPLGRPTRFGVVDGAVALSSTTPLIEEWQDSAPALADRAALDEVAAALDDHDVYAAVLTDVVASGGDLATQLGGGRTSPEQAQALLEEVEPLLPDASYDAIGIGWAIEDDRARIHVSYHFEDDDAAEAGLETLRNAWAEAPSLRTGRPLSDYVDVEDGATDGSVATVSLSLVDGVRPDIVLQLLNQREAVFVSR